MAAGPNDWSSIGRRKVPRRYPAIGFSFVGGFAVLALAMGGARNSFRSVLQLLPEDANAPTIEEEHLRLPDDTPAPVVAEFKRARGLLNGFGCVTEKERRDRQDCKKAIGRIADQLDNVVSTLHVHEAFQRLPDVYHLTEVVAELAEDARAFADAPLVDRLDRAGREEAQALLESAEKLSTTLAIALPEEADAPAQPPAETPPTVVAEASPDASVQVAAVPVAGDGGVAPEPAPVAAQEPAPGEEVDAGPPSLAQGLIKPLHDAMENLEGANHTRNLAADAAWRARARLDVLPKLLREYQEVERSPEAQAKAQSFSQDVDRARARMLRAAAELERAVTASVDRFDGTMPFEAADAALAKARADVDAIDVKVNAAP